MIHSARRLVSARCDELQTMRTSAERSQELDELQHALKRMEAGTWGQCEQCDSAIGRDRMRALPETRRCLDCTTR